MKKLITSDWSVGREVINERTIVEAITAEPYTIHDDVIIRAVNHASTSLAGRHRQAAILKK